MSSQHEAGNHGNGEQDREQEPGSYREYLTRDEGQRAFTDAMASYDALGSTIPERWPGISLQVLSGRMASYGPDRELEAADLEDIISHSQAAQAESAYRAVQAWAEREPEREAGG